jgi:hypothetical protein
MRLQNPQSNVTYGVAHVRLREDSNLNNHNPNPNRNVDPSPSSSPSPSPSPNPDLIQRTLGRGSSGTAELVKRKSDESLLVMKVTLIVTLIVEAELG